MGCYGYFLIGGGDHDFFPDMFLGGLPKISISMTEGKRLGRGGKK